MAGIAVSRGMLDNKSAQTILDLRAAFEEVTAVNAWLNTQNSAAAGGDPLTISTGDFQYSADEAYLLRNTFQQLAALGVQPILDTARALTGLQ